ncbi:hypothetical protein BC939DRAFT_435158 [Gamsiella multidivaricata]|uniref:uncharacterized protein n=1 Tax=Gamsiella multidivaricata TaxID=101098 RepID=UPI0022207886|nr:uncharacterized protein BC939DRAFT_435158 [Gamsiella multidivaricata]KAI7832310.1 hypothetical protein BC939DRAFT_435158 [Gamsiella multidivaricata]
MKFSISVAILALAASQAMAVIPIPVKECTKTVVVQPTDIGCDAFATANGITFADLLKWNLKLRTDCANLDVGEPLCVSVTPGTGGNSTNPVTKPTATSAAVTSVPAATHASATTGASKPAATTSASVTPPQTGSVVAHNAATSTKSSMALAAVGVLASVVYML